MMPIFKKIIVLELSMVLVCTNILYAKTNPFEGEVDAPTSDEKVLFSDDTIYANNPYTEYTPLNPVPVGINKEEYDSVDNYDINIDTIETRIKYFAPTYKNVKASAESSLWMAYYAKGGSIATMDGYRDFYKEYKDNAIDAKENISIYKKELKNLDPLDPAYPTKVSELTQKIMEETINYKLNSATYEISCAQTAKTFASLSQKAALSKVADVDNNSTVSKYRRLITQNLKSAVLSYLQLVDYVGILEKQANLYNDMYKLQLKNVEIGQSTAIDVSKSLDTYENAKTTLKSTKEKLKSVKSEIASNLGYNLNDIEKLNFVEPDIDFTYINNINIDKDRDIAYNSNDAYNSIRISDKDRKLPESTGDALFNKRRKLVAEKIIIELESIYNDLQAAIINYDGSAIEKEIYDITKVSNKRKLDTKLVSELEFDALELQNQLRDMEIKQSKYNLINAANNYYYAVLGNITLKQ